MSIYPETIADAVKHPVYTGTCPDENGAGRAVNFECGCFAAFSADISEKTTDRLRFRSNGCGYMIAAAEILCEIFEGMELAELKGARENDIAARIEDVLGHFPENRRNCLYAAIEAFRASLADHRTRIIEEFSGEKSLVCTCFGVTEERLIEVIAAGNLTEVSQVSDICNAGGGCGSCRMLIREYIDLKQAGAL